MPIDHLALGAPEKDFKKVCEHYLEALKPIGYKKTFEPHERVIGMGIGEYQADFWIGVAPEGGPSKNVHFAFVANDRESVKKCYEAALAAGGTDNGAPGLRPMYGPHYFGGFWRDPLGNNAEVVCKKPE